MATASLSELALLRSDYLPRSRLYKQKQTSWRPHGSQGYPRVRVLFPGIYSLLLLAQRATGTTRGLRDTCIVQRLSFCYILAVTLKVTDRQSLMLLSSNG